MPPGDPATAVQVVSADDDSTYCGIVFGPWEDCGVVLNYWTCAGLKPQSERKAFPRNLIRSCCELEAEDLTNVACAGGATGTCRLYRELLYQDNANYRVCIGILQVDGSTTLVAVKTADRAADRLVRCLVKEAGMLRELRACPDIVDCAFYHETATGAHLATRLLRTSLRQVIDAATRARSALSENVIRAYALDILKGLEAMNKKGYCHKDVKPENLLVSGELPGRVVLCDLGIAVPTDETATAAFSPWYKPECELSSPSFSFDSWSLCIVAAEMYGAAVREPAAPGRTARQLLEAAALDASRKRYEQLQSGSKVNLTTLELLALHGFAPSACDRCTPSELLQVFRERPLMRHNVATIFFATVPSSVTQAACCAAPENGEAADPLQETQPRPVTPAAQLLRLPRVTLEVGQAVPMDGVADFRCECRLVYALSQPAGRFALTGAVRCLAENGGLVFFAAGVRRQDPVLILAACYDTPTVWHRSVMQKAEVQETLWQGKCDADKAEDPSLPSARDSLGTEEGLLRDDSCVSLPTMFREDDSDCFADGVSITWQQQQLQQSQSFVLKGSKRREWGSRRQKNKKECRASYRFLPPGISIGLARKAAEAYFADPDHELGGNRKFADCVARELQHIEATSNYVSECEEELPAPQAEADVAASDADAAATAPNTFTARFSHASSVLATARSALSRDGDDTAAAAAAGWLERTLSFSRDDVFFFGAERFLRKQPHPTAPAQRRSPCEAAVQGGLLHRRGTPGDVDLGSVFSYFFEEVARAADPPNDAAPATAPAAAAAVDDFLEKQAGVLQFGRWDAWKSLAYLVALLRLADVLNTDDALRCSVVRLLCRVPYAKLAVICPLILEASRSLDPLPPAPDGRRAAPASLDDRLLHFSETVLFCPVYLQYHGAGLLPARAAECRDLSLQSACLDALDWCYHTFHELCGDVVRQPRMRWRSPFAMVNHVVQGCELARVDRHTGFVSAYLSNQARHRMSYKLHGTRADGTLQAAVSRSEAMNAAAAVLRDCGFTFAAAPSRVLRYAHDTCDVLLVHRQRFTDLDGARPEQACCTLLVLHLALDIPLRHLHFYPEVCSWGYDPNHEFSGPHLPAHEFSDEEIAGGVERALMAFVALWKTRWLYSLPAESLLQTRLPPTPDKSEEDVAQSERNAANDFVDRIENFLKTQRRLPAEA